MHQKSLLYNSAKGITIALLLYLKQILKECTTVTLTLTNVIKKMTHTVGENYDSERRSGTVIRSQSTEEQGWVVGSWN